MSIDRIHHWMEKNHKSSCKSVSELLDLYNCETSNIGSDKKITPKQSPASLVNNADKIASCA